MKKLRLPILFLFFQLIIYGSWCQDMHLSKMDSLAATVILSVRAHKEERVYIKTDKSFYSVGEKIWFRSFLVNQYTGKLSVKSSIIFVDLVNEQDSVIDKVILSAAQFKTDGYLSLPDTLTTGFYWLRAYTKDIALKHTEYIGIQAVYIINAAKPAEKKNNLQATVDTKNAAGQLKMEFFPEGGAVIGGANTVIAFRITDDKGLPQKTGGILKDDHDSVISHFNTDKFGLGKFSFFSWQWRNYTAHIMADGKPEQVFALPKIDPFAAQLAIVESKGLKKLRVVLEDSVYKRDKNTYIIGQSGDSIYFAVMGKGSYEVNIPEYRLPYGITNFLLFDDEQHLLSERKLFISGNNLQIELMPDKSIYAARQNVQLNISVADADNHPIISSMFIKVIDSVLADKIHTPINIKQQAEQLSDINEWVLMDQAFTSTELDLLMLTQKKSFKQIKRNSSASESKSTVNEIDSSFYIKGTISDRKGKPLVNRIVTLFSGAKNMVVLVDITDVKGQFCFPVISYYDQTKFNIQVTDKKGFLEETRILLDTLFRFPHLITPLNLKQTFVVDEVKEFYTNQRKRAAQDTLIMGKGWLKEVIVRTTIKKPAEYNRDKRVSSFSRILSGKMLQNGGSNNIGDALFRIPGITLRQGYLVIGGSNNGLRHPSAADEPLLIVDGVAMDTSGGSDPMNPGSPLLAFLSTFSFRIVDFIEVLKGPEAAFFGTRGSNGVILIHTKTTQTDIGDNPPNGLKIFTMPGYQVPLVFDPPDYSTKENKGSKFPDRRTLLYWNGDVVTDEKGKVSLNFYTADQPARYYISVTGITADGRLVNKQVSIDRK